MEQRKIPDPHYNWPGGPTADDDPTPLESALAALKYGAMLAATVTIALLYAWTFAGVSTRGPLVSSLTLLAFLLPSLIAYLRTSWVRRRRAVKGPKPGDLGL